MKLIGICLLLVASVSHLAALEDTPENRKAQANRYLAATPPSEMVAEMTKNMSQRLPEHKREEFGEMMTKYLDLESLRQTMSDAMVKHFTAAEIKALADFYSAALGKSAMKKFGNYMADVMPKVQEDVLKAFTATIEAKEEKQTK